MKKNINLKENKDKYIERLKENGEIMQLYQPKKIKEKI